MFTKAYKRARLRHESGQVAILFALVFTFMFILFCFVVDFAHLINAKINLQMAADAAAYAGASWQARALNKLGLINYRMRQNVKEFAMRLQVTHLRHNRNFPRGVGVNTEAAPQVEPFLCQQAHGYRALSGLRYDQDTNLCRNASPTVGGLPPIVVPPVIASFDPFAVAIAAQIRRIADAANQECRAAAEDNRVLAEHLIAVYRNRNQFHMQQAHNVETFLNDMLQGNGDLSRDGESHPIRKIAATTFYNNLSFTNDKGDETVTSGAPTEARIRILGSSADNRTVVLRENPLNGSVFFVNFNVVGDGCVGRPSLIDFDDMVGGFTKIQKVVTYFAVRAEAKPKLFFMPQAWADSFPVLVAYSAAKPFGSRLGPDSNADILLPVANRPGNNNRQVNFSFVPGDRLGIIHQGLMSLFDRLHPFNSVGRPDGDQQTGWPREDGNGVATAALQAIRAPTVFDGLFYTVFPDPAPATNYVESALATRLYPDNMDASDVAGQNLQLNESAGEMIAPIERIPMVANNGGGDPRYNNYATEGRASHSVPLAEQLTNLGLPLNKWASKAVVHSGWTPNNPGKGRIGYSVKFISFEALTATLVVKDDESGGSLRIANPVSDPDGNAVRVKH